MKNQTIAQAKGITKFPYMEKDVNGNITYTENQDNYWVKNTYDERGNLVHTADAINDYELIGYNTKNEVVFRESNKYCVTVFKNKVSEEKLAQIKKILESS